MADYQGIKRTCLESSNIDRISDLPSNIIDNILSLVPLRDAGKTSVLSRKWRCRWLNTPSLVFNTQFGWIPFGEPYPEDKMNKILFDIFQILLRHRGPLHTFSLSVANLRSSHLIDQIVLYLSGTDVQNFTLSCFGYLVPSYLFSMSQLRALSLLGLCHFMPPPAFKGFSRLTYLQLENVTLRFELSDFISMCPSLLQLKVHNCLMYYERLELNAPNLKSFSFEGRFYISFKNTPVLEEVRIYSVSDSLLRSVESKTSIFSKVIGGLPRLKTLSASHQYLKYLAIGGLPDKVPTMLKVLKLRDLHFGDLFAISSVLCLIRSSPNLQEVQIETSRDEPLFMADDVEVQMNSNPVAKLLEAQVVQNYVSDQLQCVDFYNLTSSRSAMEFVKFMLSISLHLEKMVIWARDAYEEIRILRECNRFWRASPKAQVYVEVL